jgi:hypothetical protein
MTTLVRVYSVRIDSAGYIQDKGFSASDIGTLDRLHTRDLRSTVLVEEAHEVLAVEASVSRVLVSREVMMAFGQAPMSCFYPESNARVGRRNYFDITDPEVQRHFWGGIDYPSRSNREEECRQRNINILSWLYSLLGVAFPGPIDGKRYTTGHHSAFRADSPKNALWSYWKEIIWQGPGWYLVTDRVGTDENDLELARVAERHGDDIRVWPESVDEGGYSYLHWANEPFAGYSGKEDVVLLVDDKGEVIDV